MPSGRHTTCACRVSRLAPPEQGTGNGVDHATDICSLGIVLYELISFKNPYLDPRSLHQTVMNVLAAEPVPLRELCPWLDKNLDAVVVDTASLDHDRMLRAAVAEFGAELHTADLARATAADQHDPHRLAETFSGFLRPGIE